MCVGICVSCVSFSACFHPILTQRRVPLPVDVHVGCADATAIIVPCIPDFPGLKMSFFAVDPSDHCVPTECGVPERIGDGAHIINVAARVVRQHLDVHLISPAPRSDTSFDI